MLDMMTQEGDDMTVREGAGIGEGAEAAASDASERARGAHCGGAVAGESAANRGQVISRREKSPKRPYMVSMWVTFTSFLQIYLFTFIYLFVRVTSF